MSKNELTQGRLKELLHYDPDTGVFTRLSGTKESSLIGKPAGCKMSSGHSHIRVDGSRQLSHRLAFLYMTGSIPEYVDHINGVRDDNRWCNLREVTWAQNQWNASIRKDNKAGIKGVYWCKRNKAWKASIMVNKIKIFLGQFPDLIGAELAVRKAREKYHGEFAKHV